MSIEQSHLYANNTKCHNYVTNNKFKGLGDPHNLAKIYDGQVEFYAHFEYELKSSGQLRQF